jgi:hypothetical protein
VDRNDWDLSGSIKNPKEHLNLHPWCKFDNTIEVPTIKLDDWAKKNEVEAVDFIWMDVQGAERDVLRGGQELLQRTRFLYTEYSERELYEGQPNMITILSELRGFRISKRYENDLLLERKRYPK